MADTKISNLAAVTSLGDTDEAVLAVAGASKKITGANMKASMFDATSPTTQAFGDAAVVGTAATAAHRDHKHAMMAAPTTVSGNAGTATALQTARNIDGQAFDGTGNITVIAPGTHAATGKTTPVDADELALVDSAASNVLKKLTWANLKATIKAYTDTLYPSGSGTSTGTNTGDQTVPAFATNAVLLGSAAAAGAASTVIRSNDTIAAFDVTVPSTQAFSDAAAVGTAAFAARRDHVHAMPADPSWNLYASGQYYFATIGGVSLANNTLIANRTYACLMPLRAGTLVRIGCEIGTGGASSFCRLGIFNDASGVPGTRLLDAGTVDTSGNGTKEITISQAVSTANYWFVINQQGGSAPLVRGWGSGSPFLLPSGTVAVAQGANPVGCLIDSNGWTGAFGSPFGTPTRESGLNPRIIFRYA
jgi:hypothetical protein